MQSTELTRSGKLLKRDTIISQCLKDSMCKHLSEVGYFESKGEPNTGVVAVMFSVLNRVADEKRWSSTVKGVLREKSSIPM